MVRKSRPRQQIRIAGSEADENAVMAQVLRDGASTEFWEVICKALDESLEVGIANLQQDISELAAPEYKVTNEINKAKVKFLEALKDLPNSYAEFLEKPKEEGIVKNYDPYFTASEL